MNYYSVDRRGVYVENMKIALQPNRDPNGNSVVAHINAQFPEGFSRHGTQYFRDTPSVGLSQSDIDSGVLELLLEATRKAHYPERPSRYQSVFASDSMETAQTFRTQFAQPNSPIYELQPLSKDHRGDMRLLCIADSFACIDHRIHLYWQGKTLDVPAHVPAWEYVLELPVMVGNRLA